LLVLTLAVQVVAFANVGPAVAALSSPSQAIPAPAAQNILGSLQLFGSICGLWLAQRPTWDLAPSDKFNSTLGHPGEGPARQAGASMGLKSRAAAPSDRVEQLTRSGRVSKPPVAADAGATLFQPVLPDTAGRWRPRAKPGPKPVGKVKILRLQRVHSLGEAKTDYGQKFVTPYEIDTTGEIGIKAHWDIHDARDGDVLVLKERGKNLVRRPISGASLRPPGQPRILRER
jgi:hypothetical protein